MTARFPASSPARDAAADADLAAEAAKGTATAAPVAMKSRRVVEDSMIASHATGDGRSEATVGRHLATLAIHVVRSCPVGEGEMRAVLVAALWHDLEHA